MIQTALTKEDTTNWTADTSEPDFVADELEVVDTMPATAVPHPERPSVAATVLQFEQGLYAVEIGEAVGSAGQVSGLQAPIIQLSALPGDDDRTVEIINASERGDVWLGHDGGTVVVKAPPGGGHVFVTAYGPPARAVSLPEIDVRRLDRPRSKAKAPGSAKISAKIKEQSEEIATEVVLHIERQGDRRFPGKGWVGNRGGKLRIEAFSIRPVDTLMARDIEFKALGPNRRQTPWVTDAKLCGTRGQRLPLTGFAIRPAPHIAEQFDVIYQGAFFESGIVGPQRNGELCVAPLANDPLEAISVRVVRRAAG